MRTPKLFPFALCFALASAIFAPIVEAQPTGQWDFNSGSLVPTVGAPLTFADANTSTLNSLDNNAIYVGCSRMRS